MKNSMRKKHFKVKNAYLNKGFNKRMNRCTNIFSHPDYTVGSGVTPDQHEKFIAEFFRSRADEEGIFNYRRSGISPCPEDGSLLYFVT